MRIGKARVCSVDKLNILKYAKRKGFRCTPRAAGRVVAKKVPIDATPQQRAFAPVTVTSDIVWCCGKRVRRHRKRGRRKRRAYDWQRAYRAHVSYQRPRRRR